MYNHAFICPLFLVSTSWILAQPGNAFAGHCGGRLGSAGRVPGHEAFCAGGIWWVSWV